MIIGLLSRNVGQSVIRTLLLRRTMLCRLYSGDKGKKDVPLNDANAGSFRRPLDLIKNGFNRHGNDGNATTLSDSVPRETDIVIIGGGALGMSAAYWLKQRHPEGYNVTLIERDPTVHIFLTFVSKLVSKQI